MAVLLFSLDKLHYLKEAEGHCCRAVSSHDCSITVYVHIPSESKPGPPTSDALYPWHSVAIDNHPSSHFHLLFSFIVQGICISDNTPLSCIISLHLSLLFILLRYSGHYINTTTMDSTTLITFWLYVTLHPSQDITLLDKYSQLYRKAPSEIRTVELFGSWDNFSNGYRMQYDGYKGRGSWTCCPSFERIICDGDKPNWSRPRSGALKQGGRYWYFVCIMSYRQAYATS